MVNRKYTPSEKSVYHLDNYRPNIKRIHQFVPTDSIAGGTLTVDNFMTRRYYKNVKCLICGDLIIHNQYRKVNFCLVVHRTCDY